MGVANFTSSAHHMWLLKSQIYMVDGRMYTHTMATGGQLSSSAEIKEDPRGFLQAGDFDQASVAEDDQPVARSTIIRSRFVRLSRKGLDTLETDHSRRLSLQLNGYEAPALGDIHPEDLDLDLERTLVSEEQKEIRLLSNSQSSTTLSERAKDWGLSRTSLELRPRQKSFTQRLGITLRKGKPDHGASVLESTNYYTLKSSKALKKRVLQQGYDPNVDGLIHDILKQALKSEEKRQKLLLSLLMYSKVRVDIPDTNGITALHTAAEFCDLECAKLLVAFGANVNSLDSRGRTPLDVLVPDASEMESAMCVSPTLTVDSSLKKLWSKRGSASEMRQFLSMVGGEQAVTLVSAPVVKPFPRVHTISANDRGHYKDCAEAADWAHQLTSRYSDLECNIQRRAAHSGDFTPDEAISLATQLHEMTLYQKAGSRILFLDGGGIRGLVQLEILSQLEQKTGRKIVELFDWIVGTSTGGIIALGLVYAKKSVAEVRQLYFKMKDEIFGKVRGGMTFNTAGLEAILKEEFSEHLCMDDITYPRVMITAVQKEHINLKLHFFNNCFQDNYCRHCPVWKVARYTSAAPVLFGESDEYVDGGVLANNPSESGLSRIQDFYRKRGQKLPISLVVSIGCGKYPIKKLGSVDFLFAGSSGLSLSGLKDGTSNFMSLLSYALVETSVTDENCRSRCEEQNIRYFRLNPRLTQVVDSGETDVKALLSMILQTREELIKHADFSHLVLCFHELSQACRKMHEHIHRGTDDN